VVAKNDHPRRMKLDGNLDLIKVVVKALKVRRGADLWVHLTRLRARASVCPRRSWSR
jgi:hypothetical protein